MGFCYTITIKEKWLSIIITCLLLTQSSFGWKNDKEYQSIKQYGQFIIKEIDIVGNDKTTDETILTIMKIREGYHFSPIKFLKSIQRLKNTGFFYEITYQIIKIDDENIKVIITTKDKWTILPIIVYSSGGAITEYKFGLYEGNFLGQQMAIGGYYKKYNGENYGSVWFEDRYLFNTHIRFRINLFVDGGINTFYNSNRDILFELIPKKSGGNIEFHFPIVNDIFILSLSYFLYYEEINKIYSSSVNNNLEFLNFNNKNQLINANLVQLTFGKFDLLEDYYHAGEKLVIGFEFSNDKLISDESFYYITLDGTILYILGNDITMGHHLHIGKSFSNSFYRDFILGGFENLRGFYGTRFHGENIYYLNTEIRIPFIKEDIWLVKGVVISAVPFFDIGHVWDNGYFSQEIVSDYAASAGLGFRFMTHRLSNALFRIDVAFSLHPEELDTFISTGLRHFF